MLSTLTEKSLPKEEALTFAGVSAVSDVFCPACV